MPARKIKQCSESCSSWRRSLRAKGICSRAIAQCLITATGRDNRSFISICISLAGVRFAGRRDSFCSRPLPFLALRINYSPFLGGQYAFAPPLFCLASRNFSSCRDSRLLPCGASPNGVGEGANGRANLFAAELERAADQSACLFAGRPSFAVSGTDGAGLV